MNAEDAAAQSEVLSRLHRQADHRDTEEALLAAGWTPCGGGDWAIVLRSPDGTAAARISPLAADRLKPHRRTDIGMFVRLNPHRRPSRCATRGAGQIRMPGRPIPISQRAIPRKDLILERCHVVRA